MGKKNKGKPKCMERSYKKRFYVDITTAVSDSVVDWRGVQARYAYIAGYTSGGAPYGITWEELGL